MPLTNTQYDEIMRTYQQKQLARQHLITVRQSELAERSAEFAGIGGQIAHLSVSRARRLLDGDAHALDHLREQIAELSARRIQLLKELGYPADYLNPPYDCPDCQDTGYIGRERCHCLVQASIDLIYAQSNLQDALEEENFERFCAEWYAEDIVDESTGMTSREAALLALERCRTFASRFDEEKGNLLLFGDTGVGKTFLSHCIAGELMATGHSVIYFSAHQLFDILAQSAFGRDASAADTCRNIFDCDLLIIDDLGTEMPNSFTTSQFFICLNDRIRSGKSTLISSNLELFDIASIYSERVFSRISNSFTLLHLFGHDIRIQKKLRAD